MNKKLFLAIAVPLAAAACSTNKPEPPFQPLAKVTMSFEKQSEFNVAASDFKEKQRIEQTADASFLTQTALPQENQPEESQAFVSTPEPPAETNNTGFSVEDVPFTVEFVQPEPTVALNSFFSTNEIAGDSSFDMNQDPNLIPTEADPFSSSNQPPVVPAAAEEKTFETDPFGVAQQDVFTAPEPVQPAAPAGPITINPYGKDSRGYTVYAIQEGETLTCLARRFNFNLSEFMAANGLNSVTDAGPGDTVLLPQNINTWSVYDGSRVTARHPVIYIVEAGDNFFSIACKFGDVFPDDIANANGMGNGDPLTPGQQISIP